MIPAYHLYETPLSEDQKLTKKRDGRIQLTTTVKDTQQLRWWLLGFGANVEIVKPAGLRREFQVQAQGGISQRHQFPAPLIEVGNSNIMLSDRV